jgi:hypothetical protein
MPIDFLTYSTKALQCGLSVMPAVEDGSKAPYGKSPDDRRWKQFQTELPTHNQLRAWYVSHQLRNIGYVIPLGLYRTFPELYREYEKAVHTRDYNKMKRLELVAAGKITEYADAF